MKRVYIIAEAGVNHNGELKLAKKLVDAAKKAGADCVKFQTFKAKNLASKSAAKAEYQKQTTAVEESQLDMLKQLELSFDEFVELFYYCKEVEIDFMSTAFDFESIEFLHNLGLNIWKSPSGEITNLPYLERLAALGKPIIVSTGMSTMADIKAALDFLKKNGVEDITVLHCTTEYPTPYEDVNLNAMLSIRDTFNVKIGYSDHTKGIEVPTAAVALGASVIEKHFTLDNTMEGPDHQASLEPHELKAMVDAIRHIEKAMGDGIKKPAPSEIKNIAIARKSIVASRDIKKGNTLTEDNLTTKRPGTGISPMQWYKVLGQVAIKDFEEDEVIVL